MAPLHIYEGYKYKGEKIGDSCSPLKNRLQQLHVPNCMFLLLFLFSKENLTKPQLHVPFLGVRDKGELERRLNS